MPAIVRKLLLLVLGIPFVMIGTRFLLDSGEAMYIYQISSDWPSAQASLSSVECFTSGDQAFGNQTVVRYQYDFAGKQHEGQYACVGDECPQENLFAALKTAKEQEKKLTILVDPADSGYSLLFRNLPTGMLLFKIGVGLFCFLTGGAGVVFGVYLLRGSSTRS